MKKLVFTDLDGTLLELDTYSCELVKDSVKRLKEAGVSIIFCSSKTWAEQEFYLQELKLDQPVIVENGSGIFFPENDKLLDVFKEKPTSIHNKPAIILGQANQQISKAIGEAALLHLPKLKYYANQPIDQIAEITGLGLEAAAKAMQRDFSETLFNADQDSDAYSRFENELESHELHCIPGSKFVTVTGKESDKGTAVKVLLGAYKEKYGKVISYGIGDSLNDLAMLKEVNFPYLVQKPNKCWADIHLNKLTKICAVGPAGWNVMAKEILIH